MAVLKGKCKHEGNGLSWLLENKKRLEDLIYYFAFLFVKDIKIHDRWATSIRFAVLFFWYKRVAQQANKTAMHLLLNIFYRQGTVLGTVALP